MILPNIDTLYLNFQSQTYFIKYPRFYCIEIIHFYLNCKSQYNILGGDISIKITNVSIIHILLWFLVTASVVLKSKLMILSPRPF